MDHKTIETLKNTTLFDLYKLSVVISKLLEDPIRLNEIRRKLRVHEEITYFDEVSNTEIKASILKVGRTYVLVKNHYDGKGWRIPLYLIHINECQDRFSQPTCEVDRLTLRVGERVGFITKEGLTLYGIVKKLNPRTATILVSELQWRVSYAYLFYVIDGHLVPDPLIEATI